jgi:hypothetical protein
MKNSELIKLLQKFNGEIEVTTSDNKGTYNDINFVDVQEWHSKDGKHISLTLMLGDYDKKKTLVDDGMHYDIRLDDEKFIDNVNKELDESSKIDKDDALKAKKSFDTDIAEIQKKYKEWYNKKYDKIAKDAMKELFGSEVELNTKSIQELKLHIYENGWQNELDKGELNNRGIVLRLLYHKLDEKVKQMLSDDTNKLWNDINNCQCGKKDCKKNKEYKTNTSPNFGKHLYDEFF